MGEARIASIDVGDIAEAAAVVLTGSGHEGKNYPITGPESLTMTEVAEQLSQATGNSIRYVNVPPEEAKKAQLAAGFPAYHRGWSVRAVRRAPQRKGGDGVSRARVGALDSPNAIPRICQPTRRDFPR